MYPITQYALDLFQKMYRQTADITFHGVSEDHTLTEADLLQGGLTINRYSTSGNRIQIGTCVAGELELKLNNIDGQFNSVTFEGAELYVRVGVKKWDAHRWENATMQYIPMGYFTVDEAPRKSDIITLKALDRMVMFDKVVDTSLFTMPMSLGNFVARICNLCNVTLGTNMTSLPNYDYVVTAIPDDDGLTYRQLIAWAAEITGTCGFIDWNGNLVLKWYTDTGVTIPASERFSSDLDEKSITISGVQVKSDSDVFLVGDDGYAFSIEGNELITHDERTIAENLYTVLAGFSYTPFSASVKPNPAFYPLDKLSYKDKSNVSHAIILTDVTFQLNKSTSLIGKGETETNGSYAQMNPLTRREQTIVRNLQRQQEEALGSRTRDILAFNELIVNSLGLFETSVEEANGSTTVYLHDQPTLETSMVIFTRNAGGMAWTNQGWNDGSPTWSYGVSSAGDAFFKRLSAEGINVSKAGYDYSIEVTPAAFQIYYRDMLVTEIQADRMNVPRIFCANYLQVGKIRLVPFETSGTNIIFMD